MRRLLTTAAVVALAMLAGDGNQSPASGQTPPGEPLMAAPLRVETLTATRTRLDAAPPWPVGARDREQGAALRMHDRHWSWLFPHTGVVKFGSDRMQRRHWWADPLLRRHWWK